MATFPELHNIPALTIGGYATKLGHNYKVTGIRKANEATVFVTYELRYSTGKLRVAYTGKFVNREVFGELVWQEIDKTVH